jgi:ParB/RepB/Spo0J family partition protein
MAAARVLDIPVDRIEPSPRNPRRKLSHLDELSDSIREYGLLQPVIVRPRTDAGFELVAGHRRFAAVQGLGWPRIPAIVREADADEAYLLALIENLQRDDLSPREESQALELLLRERGWSTRKVAQAVKRSASYVSRRLRVFDDPVLAPLVLQGGLSISAAEELLPLAGARKRDLAQRAAKGAWDRPRVRAAVRDAALRRATRLSGSLTGHTRAFRLLLRDVAPGALTEPARRELRLLFRELAMLAKAPSEEQQVVFPPLPSVSQTRRR